jgi:hypothetical protein
VSEINELGRLNTVVSVDARDRHRVAVERRHDDASHPKARFEGRLDFRVYCLSRSGFAHKRRRRSTAKRLFGYVEGSVNHDAPERRSMMPRLLGPLVLGAACFASVVGHVTAARAAVSAPTPRVQLAGRASSSADAWDGSTDTYSHSYIYPTSWLVVLNDCHSQVDGIPVNQSSRQLSSWQLAPLDGQQPPTPIEVTGRANSCTTLTHVPALGRWRVTLIVGPDATGAFARVGKDVTFNDVLVAAVGDSFASGEGNPGLRKRWADAQCHRSARAWTALLARSLENDSTAVTFLNLACSGAAVENLTDDNYGGVKPADQNPLKPQVVVLRGMLGDPLQSGTRGVDLLLGSVGLNAVGVGGTLVDCAADLLPVGLECQRDFDRVPYDLPPKYDELELSLSKNIRLLGPFHLIQYPARVMTNADDRYPKKLHGFFCSLNPFCTASAAKCGVFAGMRVRDKQWITRTVDMINGILGDAAKRHGWLVTPLTDLFRHHGYCADLPTRWFNSLSDSVSAQHDKEGTAHPNPLGQGETSRAVARHVQLDLRDEVTEPLPTRLTVRFIRMGLFPEKHPEFDRNHQAHFLGGAGFGVFRGARSSCDETGFAPLTGRRSNDGWTDLTGKPCMSYTIDTQGHTFAVRAFARWQGLPPCNCIEKLKVERFHRRETGYDATVPPLAPAAQPREHLTVTMEGYGRFELEYTITKENRPPVVQP